MNKRPQSNGIIIKKQFGQHFLRDHSVVDHMIGHVELTSDTSVLEIGCGDGFLTSTILEQQFARLWVFEIDPEWAEYVRTTYPDKRLTVFEDNFLDIDFERLEENKPWTVLANLPYNVSFPIIYSFQQHHKLLKEGVIMVQEEVAQKIVKTSGRGYGYASVFLQHYFDWKLLKKVPPGAFFPPPKVTSRLLYFKPHAELDEIPDESKFWKFIKICFRQPRRTLRNNLEQAHYNLDKVPDGLFKLRAQQMSKYDLLKVWDLVRTK